jgi:hypothetical protein
MVADLEHDENAQCALEFVGEDDRRRMIHREGELEFHAKSGIPGQTPALVAVQ